MSREVRDIERHRRALVLADLLCDGVAPVVVPYCDYGLMPWPGGLPGPLTPFSDTTIFSDGTAFARGIIDVTLVEDVAMGATSMTVDLNVAAELSGAEPFSFFPGSLGKRLHRVLSVESVSAVRRVVHFLPEAREAYPAVVFGQPAPVDFKTPGCRMTLRNGNDVLGDISRPIKFTVSPIFEETW